MAEKNTGGRFGPIFTRARDVAAETRRQIDKFIHQNQPGPARDTALRYLLDELELIVIEYREEMERGPRDDYLDSL